MPGPLSPAPGLRERLLALEGVAGVDLEGSDLAPSRVRITLQPDADAGDMLVRVRGLLGDWGLRSRAAPPRGKVEPEAAPPPPPRAPAAPPRPAPAAAPAAVQPDRRAPERVSVEEGVGGVAVTVSASDGTAVRRRARPGREGVAQALVEAVGALWDPEQAAPALVEMRDERSGDRAVLTVLLERPDGTVSAGSAVVRGGWEFALAKAAWAALTVDR